MPSSLLLLESACQQLAIAFRVTAAADAIRTILGAASNSCSNVDAKMSYCHMIILIKPTTFATAFVARELEGDLPNCASGRVHVVKSDLWS
jgi:hypothetical protein